MLWTITAILMILWLLGLETNRAAGGLIHILLIMALITGLVGVMQRLRLA